MRVSKYPDPRERAHRPFTEREIRHLYAIRHEIIRGTQTDGLEGRHLANWVMQVRLLPLDRPRQWYADTVERFEKRDA